MNEKTLYTAIAAGTAFAHSMHRDERPELIPVAGALMLGGTLALLFKHGINPGVGVKLFGATIIGMSVGNMLDAATSMKGAGLKEGLKTYTMGA
jgi:hypothetical protein